MHRVHDVHLDAAAMADLALQQAVGDDADHLGAGLQRGVGGDAHQPDRAAAIDQAEAARGDLASEGARQLAHSRAVARPPSRRRRRRA